MNATIVNSNLGYGSKINGTDCRYHSPGEPADTFICDTWITSLTDPGKHWLKLTKDQVTEKALDFYIKRSLEPNIDPSSAIELDSVISRWMTANNVQHNLILAYIHRFYLNPGWTISYIKSNVGSNQKEVHKASVNYGKPSSVAILSFANRDDLLRFKLAWG